jgi:hypothetical protein
MSLKISYKSQEFVLDDAAAIFPERLALWFAAVTMPYLIGITPTGFCRS